MYTPKTPQILSFIVGIAGLMQSVAANAQNAITLATLEGYGNLETAGAIAVISGDVNRNASASLAWRRADEALFHEAQPLIRVDATHFVGSLFNLNPGTAHELRVSLSDADGVSNPVTTAAFSTRPDTLVEPTLRTLFVAPTGNNANTGLSAGSAVQTLQRAADLAQAGDMVSVAAGTYFEQVTVPRSGTAAQPIVFRAQTGVVLDGSEPTLVSASGWNAQAGGVYQRAISFATGHVTTEQGRLFGYTSLPALQTLAAGAPGGFWYDGSSLYLKFSDGSAPAAHSIYAARFENGFLLDGKSFVRIENFEIRYFGASDFGKGVYLRYASDCIVRGNRIHDVGSAGVWIKGGARHRIEDNVFNDSSISGWPWDQTKGSSSENNAVVLTNDIDRGHVIRRNRISGGFNGIGPCGDTPPPIGVNSTAPFTTEVDIYRNTLSRHNDDALEPEGYCANVRIFENTITDVHMAFAVAPAAPGPTYFVRNIAYNFGNTRTSQLDGYTSSGLKINSGFTTPIGPILLYHNSFLTTAPNTEAMNLLAGGNTTFIRARNNIFSGTRYVLEKTNTVNLDWNFDLLYTTDAARFIKWQGTNYNTLAALQTRQNQELNGVNTSPQFVNPASGNFQLSAASTALDRGVTLPGINDNFSGAAPDLGALESSVDALFRSGFE
jgi:parallel beta-helix repeat protein